MYSLFRRTRKIVLEAVRDREEKIRLLNPYTVFADSGLLRHNVPRVGLLGGWTGDLALSAWSRPMGLASEISERGERGNSLGKERGESVLQGIENQLRKG